MDSGTYWQESPETIGQTNVNKKEKNRINQDPDCDGAGGEQGMLVKQTRERRKRERVIPAANR